MRFEGAQLCAGRNIRSDERGVGNTACHSLTVLSTLPLARVFPSELKATELTQCECPFSLRNSVPVETSHSLTVVSKLPLARVLPSGLKATDCTASECPLRMCNSVPVET